MPAWRCCAVLAVWVGAAACDGGDGEEAPPVLATCGRHCDESLACAREIRGDVGDDELQFCLNDCGAHPDAYPLDDRGCQDLHSCEYIDCLK